MANYTQLTDAVLRKISKRYGISKVKQTSVLDGGNSNSSYIIRSRKNKYVLTVLEEKSFKETRHLTALLQWLKKKQFLTTELLSRKNGKTIFKYGNKPIILKKWISGKVIKKLNPNLLTRIGHKLGELHQIPVPDILAQEHAFGLQMFPGVTKEKIDKKYEAWLEQQIKRLNKKLPSTLPKGLIHGDLFYDNLLIKNGKVKAIIDFEEACHYYLVFDLGMSIVGLCRNKKGISLKKAKALLAGYEQIRKLEPKEKKHLFLFIEYAATATSWWRYWKYNIDAPTPDRKNKHWEMVGVAEQARKLSKKDLASLF